MSICENVPSLRWNARVLLADDHFMVRAGIRSLLESIEHVTVMGEASDGREALEMLGTLDVNLVFMDISMPGLNGLEALSRMKQQFPHVSVVILSMHKNPEYAWKALQSGASGYLLKKDGVAQLKSAISAILSGKTYVSPEVSKALQWQNPGLSLSSPYRTLDQLSGRQREILQLIAEGENTKSIAQILHISSKTVEFHRARLMKHLGIYEIAGLVRFAVRAGLIALEGD